MIKRFTLPYETWNVHCALATVELLQKETPEFIPPQPCLPNSPDLNPVDNSMWEILQEKVFKILITDLELSTTPLTNGCNNDDMIQLGPLRSQSLFQFVQISDEYFCTSLAIVPTCCTQSDSNLGIWGHSWSGTNFEVFSCNNSMVARVRWAFQVSPGSVETLFRWGGKRLFYCAANLFRQRCRNFYHNRPSFVEDIAKQTFWSPFSGHNVVKYYENKKQRRHCKCPGRWCLRSASIECMSCHGALSSIRQLSLVIYAPRSHSTKRCAIYSPWQQTAFLNSLKWNSKTINEFLNKLTLNLTKTID